MPITELMGVIDDYAHFKSMIDLGFQVHHSEFDFDKIMLFSWIKEVVDNGRKN